VKANKAAVKKTQLGKKIYIPVTHECYRLPKFKLPETIKSLVSQANL
jgi:hypothetical protein